MKLAKLCAAMDRHADDALVVLDGSGTIVWNNGAFEERFGCRGVCSPENARTLLHAPVLGMDLEQTIKARETLAIDRDGLAYRPLLLEQNDEAVLLALLPAAPTIDKQAEARSRSTPRACREDRARLSAELACAHADYRRLADNLSTLVVRFDRNRRRRFVNKIYEEFHATSASNCLGKTVIEDPSCDPAHVADLDDKITRVIAEGCTFSLDRNYVDSRGRHICSTERIVPEYDGDGAISGALLIALGRYEEQAAKTAQLEAEMAVREIYDNVGSAVALSEADACGAYRIVSVNRAFERLIDTPAFALVGKLSTELRRIPFGQALDALRHACLEKQSLQTHTLGVGKGGQRRLIDVRFFPSLERFPGRRRVIEVYRDVTDDRYAQQRLRTLLDSCPSLLFGASRDGSITFVSPSVCEQLGGVPDDYPGRPLVDVLGSLAADCRLPLTRAIERAYAGNANTFEVSVDRPAHRRRLEFLVFAEAKGEEALDRGLLVIVRDITSLHATESELRAANAKLEQLRLDRELSIEDERKRIAHELHDDLGQRLTALRYSLANRRRRRVGDAPGSDEEQRHSEDLIDGALHSLRNVVRQLRPPALDVGLVPAVQGLIEQLFAPSPIDCDLTVVPRAVQLDDYHSLHTFRCIQEALTNIARHSQASLAYVDIRRTDDELTVRIGDNGKGFHQAMARDRHGIAGMHERTRLLNGRVYIRSLIGAGTEVTLSYRETTSSLRRAP